LKSDANPEVLFVTMPWATPVHPSLALGLFKSILNLAGIRSSCLYSNFLLPRPAETTVFSFDTPALYEDRSAGLSFVPYLYPHVDVNNLADTVEEWFFRLESREGQLDSKQTYYDGLGADRVKQLLMEQTIFDVDAAGICLDRSMEVIEQGEHDIVGFSLTFETQLIASLALAQRIKERWPDTHILFGGAACISGQGVAILKSYSFVDVVCLGEGDAVIVPLIKALRGEGNLADIKGIAYRYENQVHVTERAEPLIDLEWIPAPDYDSYFQQKRRSPWSDTLDVVLFETSRGCWWGEKHLCTFCGLNSETLTYRSKSARRVMEDISTLVDRWPELYGLQAVDNIFDMRYFKELVPLLIEFQTQREKPVGIFFEIKSNLKLSHLFLLSAAGIKALQPGIESFSDHILQLMDKGANTLQQISFIKWATQAGVSTTYNILTRNPGETADDYLQMIEIMPFIIHLPPPNGVANMQLERYSPYFQQPEKFQMYNVRPNPHYKEMFPDPNVDIGNIVYVFDFDHDQLDEPQLVNARRELTLALLRWKTDYKPHRLEYYLDHQDVVVIDRRGDGETRERLSGLRAQVFLYLDQSHSFSNIATRFPEIDPVVLRSFLESLVGQRFVYHHANDHYLAVPLRLYNESEYYRELENYTDTLKNLVPLKAKNPRELSVLSQR
jgi:ribosomal peptide maturation radical SAM protein 1